MDVKLTKEQTKLVEENMELANYGPICGKGALPVTTPSFLEDCYSVASLALCEAAIKFDPGRGVPFENYAMIMIHNKVFEFARGEGCKGMAMGTNQKAQLSKSLRFKEIDNVFDYSDADDRLVMTEFLVDIAEDLTEDESAFLYHRLSGLAPEEIAKAIDVGITKVYMVRNSLRSKIKEYFSQGMA